MIPRVTSKLREFDQERFYAKQSFYDIHFISYFSHLYRDQAAACTAIIFFNDKLKAYF